MDRHEYVDVYTDGACSNNGKEGASAGIGVYFPDRQELNVSRSIDVGDRQTNINAEIQAATEAARQASRAGVEKLQINTDCEFLVKCGRDWVPKWKENGWRKADGSAVVNQRELQDMDQAMRPLQVSWRHVPGHSGVHGNEVADKLARQGCASSRRRY